MKRQILMTAVVLALLPAAAFGVYAFGLTGLLTLATAVGSCVLTEHLFCRLNGRPTTVGDWSVTITGLLYGLTHTYQGYPVLKEARRQVAAGALGTVRKVVVEYPQGWLMSPMLAAAAMSFSSVSVIANALRLRRMEI